MTCVTNRQHRIAIEEIKLGQQAQREVVKLRENEFTWAQIVDGRDSIIRVLRNIEALQKQLSATYESRIKVKEQEHSLALDWLTDINRKLKKQKRKTFLWAAGGILSTAASIYFLKR